MYEVHINGKKFVALSIWRGGGFLCCDSESNWLAIMVEDGHFTRFGFCSVGMDWCTGWFREEKEQVSLIHLDSFILF